MYAYANLTQPRNTSSGVAEYVLIAPVSAFAVDGIKCPAAPFTSPGDEVIIKQAHQFLAGQGFIKVQLAPQKNKLDGATIGDRGFSKLDLTLEVVIPGSYAELHETVKNLLNTPLIVLIKDAECKENMYYQLGCDCASAWFSTDFTTGTTADGIKGYTGKLNYQNGYVQVYMGPSLTIKGSTVVPPVTYNRTLTYNNAADENSTHDAVNKGSDGFNGTAIGNAAANAGTSIEFEAINPRSGLPQVMNLYLGSKSDENLVYYATVTAEYETKNFRFKRAGLVYDKTVTAGDIIL